MKCTNHPERDAIRQCSECGAFLCDICVGSKGVGILKCDKCMMISALTDMRKQAQDAKKRQDKRKIDDVIKIRKAEKRYF